jgi:hypothetical protein
MMGMIDAVFRTCNNSFLEKCYSQYHLVKLNLVKRTSRECPFSDDICIRVVGLLELTYWNVSAFELGMNLLSKMTLNYRLTCTPIFTEGFLLHNSELNVTYISALKIGNSK